MAEIEKIDRGDVYVLPIRDSQCLRDDCENRASREIVIDIRELGLSACVGVYCDACTPAILERIKAALPRFEEAH